MTSLYVRVFEGNLGRICAPQLAAAKVDGLVEASEGDARLLRVLEDCKGPVAAMEVAKVVTIEIVMGWTLHT